MLYASPIQHQHLLQQQQQQQQQQLNSTLPRPPRPVCGQKVAAAAVTGPVATAANAASAAYAPQQHK